MAAQPGDNVLDPEITWSGSVAGSAAFNSEAVAVGIGGTGGTEEVVLSSEFCVLCSEF